MHDARAALIDDCWNRIGIRGDKSCPHLVEHIHCRNCPVYASAAKRLLDRFAPDLDHEPGAAPAAHATATQSVLVFRLHNEWLALPTSALVEVCTVRPVHTLPRRAGVVSGVCNVRGRLLICVSLVPLLGVDAAAQDTQENAWAAAPARKPVPRMLILGGPTRGVVTPVDEVDGIHAFVSSSIGAVPATVAGGQYATGVVRHNGRAVGVLDSARILQAIDRSLA